MDGRASARGLVWVYHRLRVREEILHQTLKPGRDDLIFPSRFVILLVLILSLVAASCATNPGNIVGKEKLDDLTVFIDGVTLKRTNLPNYCGPESLKAEFEYLGIDTPLAVIKDAIYDESLQGTKPSSLISYCREKELCVELKRGSISTLQESLNDKILPLIIVEVKPGLRHFLVVTGLSMPGRYLVCADYDGRYRMVKFEELACWDKADNLQIDISNREELKALYDKSAILESNGSYKEAVKAYNKILDRVKDDYKVYMGLGNCYAALNDLDAAFKNYDAAYKLNKDDPVLANNYSSVLLNLEYNTEFGISLAEKAVGQFKSLYESAASKEDSDRYLYRYITGLTTVGEYRELFKQYEKAIAAYKLAYELIPVKFTDMRNDKARRIISCYKKLGRLSEANEWEALLN